jgi:manganese transport protein
LWLTVVPLAFSLILLVYIVLKPFITKSRDAFHNHSPHNLKLRFSQSKVILRKNIAVSVDFSNADEVALNSAFELGGTAAKYTLIHVVETVEQCCMERMSTITKL